MFLALIIFFFFFNDTATTEIYTLSLHDALPISIRLGGRRVCKVECDCARPGRSRDRNRRRADEPGGFLIPGDPQGAPAGSRPPGRRARERRVLSVPGRGG